MQAFLHILCDGPSDPSINTTVYGTLHRCTEKFEADTITRAPVTAPHNPHAGDGADRPSGKRSEYMFMLSV
jgi:hypothetical protein